MSSIPQQPTRGNHKNGQKRAISRDFDPKSSKNLQNSAKRYRNDGFCPIPVRGAQDLSNFKASSVIWRDFQQNLPTFEQIEGWFAQNLVGGLALVCGRVSQLAVLDFDNVACVQQFAAQHPDLADTFMVRSGTRGLPHLYYRVPADVPCFSRRADGVDWQHDGCYVIAPPTEVGEYRWTVADDKPIRTLTAADVARVFAFLDACTPLSHIVVRQPGPTPAAPVVGSDQPDLVTRYLDQIGKAGGRNNALFNVCLWARDHGLSHQDMSPVVTAHIGATSAKGHTAQSADSRRREGWATVRSAFSRPARRARGWVADVVNGVGNALRERLLALGHTPLLRVLEAVYAAGWQVSSTFTQATLGALAAAHGIGDWSVRRALAAQLPDGGMVFTPVPAADSCAGRVADCGNPAVTDDTVLNAIERGTEPTGIGAGRPAQHYQLPPLRQLCQQFGVPLTSSDALAQGDLGSVARYRAALHGAFLRRRPGTYHRDWLAARLSVSAKTSRRYDARARVQASARFTQTPVTQHNAASVIPEDIEAQPPCGVFLQDAAGRRFPPRVGIARRLLRAGAALWLTVQRANYYAATGAPTAPPLHDNAAAGGLLALATNILGGTVRQRAKTAQDARRRPFEAGYTPIGVLVASGAI